MNCWVNYCKFVFVLNKPFDEGGKRMNVGKPARFLKGNIILNHNYAAFQNKFLKGLGQHHGKTHVTLPGANFENKSFPSCFFVLFVCCCSARSETGSCAKKNENSRKCGGRCYILSKELVRVAQLPMGSTVCRVHWEELWRSNIRCSVPRSTHSGTLRRHSIPARLFAVLDTFGEKMENYKPGTRWCIECNSPHSKSMLHHVGRLHNKMCQRLVTNPQNWSF